jgi:hypothetical protein
VERFHTGDDILERLTQLAIAQNVKAGSLSAIGALQRAVVGFFVGEGQYSSVLVKGPLELLSCTGNISLKDGTPFVHAHMTVANHKGRAYGGHIMRGCIVGPTFEATVHVYDDIRLTRDYDETTKLYLLNT